VLGSARSGTTLLQAMLNRHPALWAPGELHLASFDTMSERAHGVGNPFLRGAFVPEAAERLGESPQAFAERLQRWEHHDTPTVDVYRSLVDADSRSAVLDKTPTYGERRTDLEWIGYHFPNARYVHLVRDPFDVAASFVRMQLHRGSVDRTDRHLDPYHCAEASWFRLNDTVVSGLSGVPSERWCRIRYEDLVRDPASMLGRVCEVLDVDYVDQLADPYADRTGPIARGAGDPSVNLHRAVEARASTAPWFPLGQPTRRLVADLGYELRPPGTGG
jgi:LPS sulfotransferase NodH